MFVGVVDLRVVINIININLELVIELEVVLAGNLGDELGVQVVVDDLGLADLEPLVAVLFVHEEDRIRLGESVLVLEGLALEGKLKFLDWLVGVHRVLSQLKNSFVEVTALAKFGATDSFHVLVLAHASKFGTHNGICCP